MKIFQVNFNNLVHQLLPTFLRKETIISLLYSIIEPIKGIHEKFIEYRENNIYKLGINSQVCYLEKSLNDKFKKDLKDKRIIIKDDEICDQTYVFTKREEKPLYIYTEKENKNKILIYTDKAIEENNTKNDFLVCVPDIDNFESIKEQIKSLVDTFKLPSKKFQLEYNGEKI